MAVNLKLVLAEALSELKKSEAKERATDADLEKMSKSSSKHHDWPSIKRSYSQAYDNYISALELLNYCRRTGMDHKDQEMITFCGERMKIYMDRCEKLRTKESTVLTSVRDADNTNLEESYLKEGYTWGDMLFEHQRTQPIKGSTPVEYQHTLKDGAYYLQVKNYDDYAVAAPQIKVQLMVKGRAGQSLKQQKIIPALTCWGKNIGVVSSSEVMIRVVSDGMVRTSQVEVTLRELIPPPDTVELKEQLSNNNLDTSWVDSLPALPGAAPSSAGGGGPLPPPTMQMPELPPPDMNNFGFGLIMPESGPGGAQPQQQGQQQQHQPFYSGGGGMCLGNQPLPHEQQQQQRYDVMPPSGPLGGEGPPGQQDGSPVYPLSAEHQGSTELLGSLSVPGGTVGSPVMGVAAGGGGEGYYQQQQEQEHRGEVGIDDLANLQVPYHANRASNPGNNGKAAGPTPYFGNPVYGVPHPGQQQGGGGQVPAPEGYPIPTAGGGGSSSSSSPQLPPRERAKKPNLQPEIQKPGASAEDRLARVKSFMDYYLAASAGEKAMAQAMTNPEKYTTHLQACNPETRELAEKITVLPEPTELGMDDLGDGDLDLGDMDLDMADLEAGNF